MHDFDIQPLLAADKVSGDVMVAGLLDMLLLKVTEHACEGHCCSDFS
jgi:hypothetical protein